MFGGRSWRDDSALLPVMCEAFWLLRQVQELRLLLDEARKLPLVPGQMRRRDALDHALEGDGGWTLAALWAFEQGRLAANLRAFLRSLAPAVRGVPALMRLEAVGGVGDAVTALTSTRCLHTRSGRRATTGSRSEETRLAR